MSSAHFARLEVSVKQIKIEKTKVVSPYVTFRLGDTRFKTANRPPTAEWTESFDFMVTHHAHLFNTVQVDVYETRTLFPAYHVGRTEIRLSKLAGLYEPFISWFELFEKKYSFAGLTDLNVREKIENVGAIQLEINYRLSRTSELELSRSVSPLKTVEYKEQSVASSISSTFEADLGDPKETPEEAAETAEDIAKASAKIATAEKKEITGLFQRLSGFIMSDDDYQAIRGLQTMISHFGQGVEVSNYSLTVGFFLLKKFYDLQPMEFGNKVVMTKQQLELPRLMYRYTMATMGWKGLNFFGKGRGMIYDSIRSQADLKAVLEYLAIPETDILVFKLSGHKLYRPNFYITLDRRISAIVLSIRGTMSMRDTLTDLACEYVPWKGGLVHSGMLAAAQWFSEDIGRQLFLFAEEYGVDNIYICGHSLGAGTAALTTIILQDYLVGKSPGASPSRPINVHCYGFGTPALVSPELCSLYADHIDSFINGDDLVPRLSYGSVLDLQLMLVYAAEIGGTAELFKDMATSPVYAKLEACRRALQSRHPPLNPKLFVPGTLHHMLRLPTPKNKKFTVVESVTPDRFNELYIKTSMLTNHLPSKYDSALEQAYLAFLYQEMNPGPQIKSSPADAAADHSTRHD